MTPLSNIVKDSKVNDMIAVNNRENLSHIINPDNYDILHFRYEDMKDAEKLNSNNAQAKRLQKVPEIVSSLFPELKTEEFEKLKKSYSFGMQSIVVCDLCFVSHSEDKSSCKIDFGSIAKGEIKRNKTDLKSLGKHTSTKLKFINTVRHFSSKNYCLRNKTKDGIEQNLPVEKLSKQLELMMQKAPVMNLFKQENRNRRSKSLNDKSKERENQMFDLPRLEGKEIKAMVNKLQENRLPIVACN